jgi:predicted phage baseplate assembly protein
VVFTPPLVGRYDLSRTVLLGNVVEVSHGRTAVRTQRGPGPWPVTDEPLAWLPDPSAPDGRVPAVHLEVGGQAWAPTTDLTSAGPQARVFEVDRDAAGHSTVVVGDDNEGAAVPAVADVRLATRVGTGQGGNRPAGAVDEIGASAPLVAATSNPLPAGGGADAEDPAAARASAVAGVQALDRAVTTDDLQALVLSYGLVRRARVVHDPVRRRRHLTVIVSGDGGRALTQDEHRTLRAFLAARVPPGVALHTVDRVVVGVRAAIRLEVLPGADALQVVADAYRGLGATAHATNGLPPVEAPGLLDPDAVDLGQTIHRSDLHRALATVPGLARVAVDTLHRADAPPGRADRLAFAPAELPRWDDDTGGVPALAVRWEVWVDR